MTIQQKVPTVGFVSLGCPKASSDAERILTKLRAEGYEISPSYDNSDLVIVNTCGFIDAAVEESLDAIGEALNENGKVIVTGCLGAKGDIVQSTHPSVLAVTGPHAADEVMGIVHQHLPKPHDPYSDLVPPQGVRLTPDHFAYQRLRRRSQIPHRLLGRQAGQVAPEGIVRCAGQLRYLGSPALRLSVPVGR